MWVGVAFFQDSYRQRGIGEGTGGEKSDKNMSLSVLMWSFFVWCVCWFVVLLVRVCLWCCWCVYVGSKRMAREEKGKCCVCVCLVGFFCVVSNNK